MLPGGRRKEAVETKCCCLKRLQVVLNKISKKILTQQCCTQNVALTNVALTNVALTNVVFKKFFQQVLNVEVALNITETPL